MMFRMHMAKYGTTTRQLSEVSVAFRKHALLNPTAVMKKPITSDDHASARRITEPLGLLDYCLINDGAVCMILTTAERAKDLAKPPVLISGVGARDAFERSAISNFDQDFWYKEIKDAGTQAFEMAGVTHDDVDALMCYDNFSPTVLFSLEGLGYCGQGEAGEMRRKDGRPLSAASLAQGDLPHAVFVRPAAVVVELKRGLERLGQLALNRGDFVRFARNNKRAGEDSGSLGGDLGEDGKAVGVHFRILCLRALAL
jgi:hypothetical protein